ncbi:MAG: DUF6519 domain-containing protein [Methylobacter sp.]|uniref:DUF6519 domain-containing protein n=1 Tax=Candidatus Methylobacter titanis TaxID=3053457 RepID=A0AA43TND1_9GAMM|nr:DUF6519 domain-containing protein [Candidatus Methylobacter titanis]MDI1292338.1 DUF6519 domain-containing protein [Candidatus Methylobacter titanis]
MKGDFSKMTFAPDKNFLRVLMQQGRVQLDADENEQVAILLHYMQTLAADLIGPYAGPEGNNLGFKINVTADKTNLSIGKGRYYVDGVLCENHHDDATYFKQPDYPLDAKTDALSPGVHLVYLDVWERHISYLEDDDIREKALNGLDTSTRSKVIWQVKTKELTNGQTWLDGVSALKEERVLSEVCLRAGVHPVEAKSDACCQHPDASYRGAENQLYRIEIHNPGNSDHTPTFKWSRDNGAVAFPVTAITADAVAKTMTVELENLGRDAKSTLSVNDWVELVDDDCVLRQTNNLLCQVYSIDNMTRTVVLTGISPVIYHPDKHPLIRRWDQKGADVNADGVAIKSPGWLPIEAGIEIEFKLGETPLRTGDYWLIPARTSTGQVEWPSQRDNDGNIVPAFMRPIGVEHRYAPLAIIMVSASGNVDLSTGVPDFRCSFKPLAYGCQYSYYGRLGQGIGTGLLCPEEE